jgi:hypothetical protein
MNEMGSMMNELSAPHIQIIAQQESHGVETLVKVCEYSRRNRIEDLFSARNIAIVKDKDVCLSKAI